MRVQLVHNTTQHTHNSEKGEMHQYQQIIMQPYLIPGAVDYYKQMHTAHVNSKHPLSQTIPRAAGASDTLLFL